MAHLMYRLLQDYNRLIYIKNQEDLRCKLNIEIIK